MSPDGGLVLNMDRAQKNILGVLECLVCQRSRGQNMFSTIKSRVKGGALCHHRLTLSLLQQLRNDLHRVLCVTQWKWGLWRCRDGARRTGWWVSGPLCGTRFHCREQNLGNNLSRPNENTLLVNADSKYLILQIVTIVTAATADMCQSIPNTAGTIIAIYKSPNTPETFFSVTTRSIWTV